MGKLDDATLYLSGSMEYAHDQGITWRREFINLAKKSGLKIHCIDPTSKPGARDLNLVEDKEYQEKLQKEGKFEELKQYVHRYRHFDLRYVDISDILIVGITPGLASWGSADEVFTAERQKKPRMVICPGKCYNLPRWLFDVFDLNDVFESVEEVIERLVKIDNGEIELDPRWILIRRYINEL